MFNTPILDIILGLVFIFLLYSLLATSVKEGIASLLGLRARMLKRGIVEAMLADTPTRNRWVSMLKGIIDYIKELLFLIFGKFWQEKKLGYLFYKHPVMKNYGSNRIFSHPSYLSATNFCMVLIETLKEDLQNKIELVTDLEIGQGQGTAEERLAFQTQLLNSADMVQVKALLEWYAAYYSNAANLPRPPGFFKEILGWQPSLSLQDAALAPLIGPETLQILLLHLKKSIYNIDDFGTRLSHWFDDTMDRVSGWYKRQVQVILLIIGFVMALIFNVDVIDITIKLSKDDKLRDKLVQSAVAYSKAHESLPGDEQGTGGSQKGGTREQAVGGGAKEMSKVLADSIARAQAKEDSGYRQDVKDKFKKVDSMVDHDIHDVNTLLALGYGDYGRSNANFVKELKDKTWWCIIPYHWTKCDYDSIRREATDLRAYLRDSLRCLHDDSYVDIGSSHHADWQKWIRASGRDTLLLKAIGSRYTLAADAAFGPVLDSITDSRFYTVEVDSHPIHTKTAYMWYSLVNTRHKWLGFLLLGLAVCMGAPFWFDLLNKIVNLRSTGKKEEDSRDVDSSGKKSADTQPVVVNVNNQPGTQEAVG